MSSNDESTTVQRGGDWIGDVYRLLHLDAHFGRFEEIYRNFDAEKAAEVIVGAGFQVVSFMAMDGPSYYPTRIGEPHPGLDRDFVGEFTRALQKRGLKCLVYVTYDLGFDYEKLDREAIPQLTEILDWYDVDGFFLDGPMQPFMRSVGYTEHARELYGKEVGGEIPTDDSDPRGFAFRRWANRHMDAFLEKTYRAVAAIKPGVVIFYNGAWMFRYPVTPPSWYKFVEWDTATPDSGFYSYNYSLEGRYLASLPGIAWACMGIDASSWEDYSLREPEAFMHESALLLAAGGRTYLSDNPYPSGNPDPALVKVYTEVNRRTRALEPFLKDCRPVKETAVLHSADAIWSKTPVDPTPEWRPGPAYQPVVGVHKALTEGHVQMAILNSEVFADTLHEYKVAVLADQRILSEREGAAIRAFVRQGGVLIATGETGTRDADNEWLRDFALADVLGVEYRETVDTSFAFLRMQDEDAEHGIPAMDVPVRGNYVRIRTTTAETRCALVPPYEGIKTGTPPPAEEAEGPGVTVNAYGKGKAVYCAAKLFDAYAKENTPVLRKIGLWMLDQVHPRAARTIVCQNTPIRVEMFYNERAGERFVHLVNYCADKREYGTPYVQDFSAVHGIRIEVQLDDRPVRVTRVPGGEKVAYTYENGWIAFVAEPLIIHEVYWIESV